jgi:hypothetical protein
MVFLSKHKTCRWMNKYLLWTYLKFLWTPQRVSTD